MCSGMKKLLTLLSRHRRAAPLPQPRDPIDDPAIRRMDLRLLADLPLPRPEPPPPASPGP
jgi:hypothetical protein